jgi:RHS repeat-associated protein
MVAEYSTASQQGSGTSYLTADSLGTPRVITGADASVKARHDYMPFGEEVAAGTGGRTTGQGYVGDNVSQKFTGHERDIETGLDYMQARYYSSTQGRFTSIDPVKLTPERMRDPQRFNLYEYTINNPLKYVDPDGKDINLENDTRNGRFKALLSITANMKPSEAKNVGVRWNKDTGKYEVYIKDPSKINLNKASQGYQDLVDRVGNHALKLNYTFLEKGQSTTVELNGVPTKVTQSALSGANGSDAGGFVSPQSDGSIAVVVAEGGYQPGVAGLTPSGQETTVAFPDYLIAAHELFGETYKYTPAGTREGLQNNVIDDSNKVIEIENKYRDFHRLPHRSGTDHGYIHGPMVTVTP